MIVKKRELPLAIQKLQALNRRLPPNHHKYSLIRENLAKAMAGYKGELSIDYPLSLIRDQNLYILHDLRLFDKPHYFQVDTLVLTHNYIVILEVKNIAGSLFFDREFNQLIRIQDGKEEAFPDPLIQINRQEIQLKRWLSAQRFSSNIPVTSLIVISNPSTILRATPENKSITQKVIHRDYLPAHLNKIKKLFQEEMLIDKDLRKIIRQLKQHHSPLEYPILENYQLTKEELLKGVQCTRCNFVPMTRVYATWHCPGCQIRDKNAHITSLKDYALLISSQMTNKQGREFLKITQPSLMKRLLQQLEFSYIGTNKSRTYSLAFKH